MYQGSLYHGDVIAAFQRHVPDCYVRDYRDRGGYIVIARGLKNILWRDQTTTRRVYRQVPDKTLCNLPRGFVQAAGRYNGMKLMRPGWRREFRRAAEFLTHLQMRRITRELGAGEVFAGVY